MKIAICDDEYCDLSRIKEFCAKYDDKIPVYAFSKGRGLLQAFQREYYDLIFLDIEMEAPNGLVVGKELAAHDPPPIIIFTTHSLNYAIRGYGIALRYLLKPIDYATFSGVMYLAMGKIMSHKISISYNGNQLVLEVNSIFYVEVMQHQIVFHLKGGKTASYRGSLSEVKEHLPSHLFAQPHKSYIVNLDCIDHMDRQAIYLTNNCEIPLGRGHSESFHIAFNEYLRGRSTL